jgi:hypothetical protein
LPVLLGISFNIAAASDIKEGVDAGLGTLVSTQWLAEHLDDPDLVILDCSVLITQDEDGSMRSLSGRGL